MKPYKFASYVILLLTMWAFLFLCVFMARGANAQGPGGQCHMQKGWGWSMMAAATKGKATNAKPAAPVGDTCQTCNGTGKVGDGRVFQTCKDCNGTGKTKKSQAVSMPAANTQKSTVCVGGQCYTTTQMVYTPQTKVYRQQTYSPRRTWFYRRF